MRSAARIAQALTAAVAAGCGAPATVAHGRGASIDTGAEDSAGQVASDALALSLTGVTYTLDWALGRATVTDAGVTWTTAAGDQIRLREGYLVTSTATLVPCAELSAARTAPPGHGTFDDPSSSVIALAEPLHAPVTAELARFTFDETAYCRAHLMLSPDLNGGGRMPEDVAAIGWSLRLSADYTTAAGAEGQLEVSTAAAWGELWSLGALDGAAALAAAPAGPVELVLTRRLDTLFDGLAAEGADLDALAADGGATLGGPLLAQLIADTTARLRPGPAL
ncbi:MAG: hypothetical protein RL071_1233 [Pseudomonadota bacterium]|jgi:hypothetical protein